MSASKQEGDEAFGLLHIYLVSIAEELNTFFFVRLGSRKEERGCDCCNGEARPGRKFEKYSPRQQEQGTIQRMADVMVNAARDELSRLLER